MRRLLSGGWWIDRSRAIEFTFDGREHQGFDGDTLASALLAGGITGGFRSPILGRPRGVMSAGPEEPNAFVEVREPWFDLIAPATMVPLVDGLVAVARAGVGALPQERDPAPAARHRYLHVETLVIGGGRSGLARAADAAGRGDRVMLVDERHRLGGTAWPSDGEVNMGGPPLATFASTAGRALQEAGGTILTDAAAVGIYDDGYVIVHQRSRAAERLWHVRAQRVVVATGRIERPIAFAGNDRPGVMLAGAVGFHLDRFGIVPGDSAVVFTTTAGGYATAWALADAGVPVTVVAPVGHGPPANDRRVETLNGWTVIGTAGSPELSAVRVSDGRNERVIETGLLAVSGGWNPALSLYRAIGGGLRYQPDLDWFVPDGNGPAWLEVVGGASGTTRSPIDGRYPFVPADDYAEHFVDLQRDQTVADVQAVLEGGLRSVEHVKRATYIGTAVDQGRTSGALAAEVVNQLLGMDPGAQGPTNARPPWTPLPFHLLAGPYRGTLFDPERVTPIHRWHVEHGAVFEPVGQWLRPRYYPRDGEDLDPAVLRECAAVRTSVGMQDASTLGKIDVVGPDADVFLDRMYSNAMSTLKVGRIRYGFMLGVDGMVFDDGVAMRLSDDHYLVTTTTGGAARVLDHLEEWLQTEWPDLRVYCTSVTEQWATVAVAGPRAREVVGAAGCDVDLSHEAFPFMTWRDGQLAGVPVRLARVSFSGELAIEVWTPGVYGRHVWEALSEAGRPFDITPYGTEAMHVLRAEKGYVIVGQDTDGTVTPYDLGMSWIVSQTKGDFVGRRSLRRPDATRPDRKQLVGLLPVDPDALLQEGAQLVLEDTGAVPVPMAGHVTSSYRSVALGRTFALAMVQRGSELHGQTVYAPGLDGTIAAEVTAPIFYDPEGTRRDG